MKRFNLILISIVIAIILLVLGLFVAYYLGFFYDDKGFSRFVQVKVGKNDKASVSRIAENKDQNLNSETAEDSKAQVSKPVRVEELVTGLDVPWSIVFTSKSRMLVTERPGQITQILDNKIVSTPLHVFSDNKAISEAGLMGMVIDPDYSSNKYIYVCYTYEDNGIKDKVVRFTDNVNNLTDELVLIQNIPAAKNHAGCKLKIGSDKKLYVTTGDATTKSIAQDQNNLGGKILRINLDGTVPDDNPFFGSKIYTLGHRNPQGLDWNSNGTMFSAEHGPSGFDGPGGGDEINIIKPGQNYGWPMVSHDKKVTGYESPLLNFTPAIAPSALMVYKSDVIPQFKNNIFVAMLKGEGILRIVLNTDLSVDYYQKLKQINVGRVREIVEGPDGFIYFTSSNRDGRGKPKTNDDKIYRIML